MALGSFLWENYSRGLQQGLVGAARKISGREASRRAQRTGFRSRREISRGRKRSLCAVFSRGHSTVPVSPCAVQAIGIQSPTASLLDLQQQSSRRAPEQNAGNGSEPSLAGSARGDDRRKADGRHSNPRLFRATEKMARRAE